MDCRKEDVHRREQRNRPADLLAGGLQLIYFAGVKGAEREDPTLKGGDESGAALRHTITRNYTLL